MWIHRRIPDIRKYCTMPWTGVLDGPLFLADGVVIRAGTMIIVTDDGRIMPLET